MRNFRLDDESGHQEALFSWAAYRTGLMPELQYMYHVPNGGKRDKATAAVLKRQGVKAGVPDIMLPAARAGYHGLYIELKAGENTTTKKQKEWLEYLRQQGYYTAVCYGWQPAAQLIEQYLLHSDELTKEAALIRAKEEDGLEIQGKMRDLVAAMINESSTNVARMDAINNNATPEIKEQLKEGNLGITAAYEAAKLDEDEQKEIAEKAAAGENVRAKEIAEKVAEKKAGDDYETPHPESITSLCYSCQKYKDCNVKTGTCQKCDQYINKAEAEKTDEQRYSEEQDAIDRQTKKKLQERADTEKMEHLPSEGNIEHKQHELKIVASDYEDIVSGKKSFELRKNDRGYKQGDNLKMLEFKDGKHTGRTIDADIIYMLEDYTGLTEGYCILGIRVTDYTGKVSETDTESGAEHE